MPAFIGGKIVMSAMAQIFRVCNADSTAGTGGRAAVRPHAGAADARRGAGDPCAVWVSVPIATQSHRL